MAAAAATQKLRKRKGKKSEKMFQRRYGCCCYSKAIVVVYTFTFCFASFHSTQHLSTPLRVACVCLYFCAVCLSVPVAFAVGLVTVIDSLTTTPVPSSSSSFEIEFIFQERKRHTTNFARQIWASNYPRKETESRDEVIGLTFPSVSRVSFHASKEMSNRDRFVRLFHSPPTWSWKWNYSSLL